MLSTKVAIQEIKNHLNLIKLDYIPSYMVTTNESAFETDIFIPSLKLGIIVEHPIDASPDTNIHRTKDTAQKRALAAKAKNIGLIQFTTDEIPTSNKYQRLTAILTAATLTLSPKGARQYQLQKPNKKDTNAFLTRWHIQGPVRALQETYGLTYDNQLAAIIVLGKSRFKTADLELIRYCTNPYTPITGGFQKLLAATKKKHPNTTLISYADLTTMLRPNNIYETNNFTHLGNTPPDYKWINIESGEIKSRYQCMKQKLIKQGADPNLTEIEIMQNNNFIRIFGAGSLRYTITL